MESFKTALAAIFLLFSLATAQITPKAKPSCQEPLASGGNDYLPHEQYCQLFYRCYGGNLTEPILCGGDLFFDTSINGCNYPGSTKCSNWPCTATSPKANYPALCGDQYFTCNGDGFMKMTCTAGQRFDAATGTCIAGAPVDHQLCIRAVRNDSAVCPHKADEFGDICKYQTVDGNVTHKERACPDKTAFNETTCGCTILSEACPKPNNKFTNKLPDNMCRASLRVTFDLFFAATGSLRGYSDKISAELNDSFLATGVTYNSGIASLRTTIDTIAQIYWYYMNANELTRSTGFSITFRAAAPTTTPIYLFTNNFNDACMATLNVTATLAGNTYSVTAQATFMTRVSQTNITYVMDSVTGTLAVAQPNSYLEVTIVHDTMFRLKLTDKGTSGTTTGQIFNGNGTANLGTSSTYAYNKCGLAIGRGLTGDISEFSVYEGCRDTTILLNR